MKNTMLVLIMCLFVVPAANAREDVGDYSVSEALSIERVKDALNFGADVQLYFGDQTHASLSKNFGEFSTNKKTSAFGKGDKEACQWAFASAIKALKERAHREGGNAVVNIVSNYDNVTTSSQDTFKCGAGNIMVGVALKGTVVEL